MTVLDEHERLALRQFLRMMEEESLTGERSEAADLRLDGRSLANPLEELNHWAIDDLTIRINGAM